MIDLSSTNMLSHKALSGSADIAMGDMTNWATPLFSRNQVDRAGFAISGKIDNVDLDWAIEVINNWRSSHSYPLINFHINLRQKVRNIQNEIIVAQRIKRIESIVAKLQKYSTQLTQMQDIGGCRAVLNSPSKVNDLLASYKRSRFNHTLKSQKDYISDPKADGYRGHHLIFQYQSLPNQITSYDKLRIEIQIRTKLQHAWATAVEAVGIFTGQALKSNQGDKDWLRLFSLMSGEIAAIEKCPSVPGVPSNAAMRKKEISSLVKKLNALQKLSHYQTTLKHTSDFSNKNDRYYLVIFNFDDNTVAVQGFGRNRSQEANDAYTAAETRRSVAQRNVVLVSVDSMKALKKAYPNYFLDTEKFRQLLMQAID